MEKIYNPNQIEQKWYKFWLENNLFRADANSKKQPFTIVIPPPNVTGILHMGHVLNNTLQDIMVRYKKLQGYETLWLPGTDHAGIATQNVVERELQKEGKTRYNIGREKLVEMIWKWKEENGSKIISQLKKLGASCDWQRERFTMDQGLSKAVNEVFIRLYEKKLIYKGKYIINWCPRCETALSDDEVDYEDKQSHLWYINYPIKDTKNKFITVATTRPETMLGDTAVAINPTDERFKHLIGKTVIIPLVEREVPIIADDFVEKAFGTGCVKVTPAHDPNDFEMGRRHNLKQILIMDEKGIMNKNAGETYNGLDRFACRKKVVKDLQDLNLLNKIEDYQHSVGHCYRCKTVIEPYLSTQWFVKMKPLAKPAIEVVKNGMIKFQTPRWEKVYYNWLENIHDWCISRQIWWGHRIPAYYCNDCGKTIVSAEIPENCPECGSKSFTQETDVLDTWFSSWLWPFSTMGWPQKTAELEYFFPTDVLVTDPGIIFFWVARMVMASLEFTKNIPFKNVYIHGTVLDEKSIKMSKSLGNSPDPLDVIEQFGADAIRFSMVFNTPKGENVVYTDSLIETGRNFANKVWNAARFIFMNAEKVEGIPEKNKFKLELSDKWILSRLNKAVAQIIADYEEYRFKDTTHRLYDFFWNEFCAWYLELIKDRFYNSDDRDSQQTAKYIMLNILDNSLRMLHPVMPFLTEEIWQRLKSFFPEANKKSIMLTEFPKKLTNRDFDKDAEDMELIIKTIIGIRSIRKDMNIPLGKKVNIFIKSANETVRNILLDNHRYLKLMAKIDKFEVGNEIEKPYKSITTVIENNEIFMPLEGVIDVDKEVERLNVKLDKINKILDKVGSKLKNRKFLNNAPAEIVQREKDNQKELTDIADKLQSNISRLKG
ncbi:MAG: valine--tRNA ligase [Candidatus Cloacimonadota bacterium]|nr:valine--tRNA ligase [Candidatus Cloacimonadota bacterium]